MCLSLSEDCGLLDRLRLQSSNLNELNCSRCVQTHLTRTTSTMELDSTETIIFKYCFPKRHCFPQEKHVNIFQLTNILLNTFSPTTTLRSGILNRKECFSLCVPCSTILPVIPTWGEVYTCSTGVNR